MDLKEKSIVGCFPEFVFLFSVVQVLVGLRRQFMNNFVFPTWACADGFNNNNKNNNNNNNILLENNPDHPVPDRH